MADSSRISCGHVSFTVVLLFFLLLFCFFQFSLPFFLLLSKQIDDSLVYVSLLPLFIVPIIVIFGLILGIFLPIVGLFANILCIILNVGVLLYHLLYLREKYWTTPVDIILPIVSIILLQLGCFVKSIDDFVYCIERRRSSAKKASNKNTEYVRVDTLSDSDSEQDSTLLPTTSTPQEIKLDLQNEPLISPEDRQ